MVVTGDHVLGPQVHKRNDRCSINELQVLSVLRRQRMRAQWGGRAEEGGDQDQENGA